MLFNTMDSTTTNNTSEAVDMGSYILYDKVATLHGFGLH